MHIDVPATVHFEIVPRSFEDMDRSAQERQSLR